MLCALIMAGGKGTRFWPLSTEEKPKQFLNLLGEDTMLQMTVKRLEKLIPIDRIFVVTGKKYRGLVKEQLTNLPERNIIIEPVGKNTAPCIALSAFHINRIYSDATIAVLPSDHLIKDTDKYLDILSSADEFVSKNRQAIVTIGIKPDRAETGYGYIQCAVQNSQCTAGYKNIYKVNRFVEKPNKEKAEKYLEEGNYLWNAGMFVWKAENILRLTCKHLKNTFEVLSEVAAAGENEYKAVLEKKYNDVDCVSVDYGIMEKEDNIFVIPGEFRWDDVGTWSALERYSHKDDKGNICVGSVKSIDGSNNMIVAGGKKIILQGLSDVYVVENDGVVVIGKKDKVDEIREIRSKNII